MIARWTPLIGVFLAICFLVGCTPAAPKPVPVSGTVELDGKPMPDGTITFTGDGMAPAELDIKDGKFEGQSVPGSKKVEIRAFKIGPETKMGDQVIPGPKTNYIPDQYNTRTTLKTEITATGLNPSKFEVKSN